MVGEVWLVGEAPGLGGRRLKSGGMTSGDFVTTANSSGGSLVMPAAWRIDSQPISDRASPASVARRRISWVDVIRIFLFGGRQPSVPAAATHHRAAPRRPG